MQITENPIGRKMLMTATGLSLTAFITIHLLGNIALFAGPSGMNSYARALQGSGPFIWTVRSIMAATLVLHVWFGIQLTLDNRRAKPKTYAVRNDLASTFAGRNMIWSGLYMAGFIFYHLLHFTFQVINPELSARGHADAMGRPDVYMMVIGNFRNVAVSALYVSAMGVLGLHLMHSIQSSFQTLGLNSERTFPFITRGGGLFALLVFLGFASFPVAVISGLLR